jgi:hypothetical protein
MARTSRRGHRPGLNHRGDRWLWLQGLVERQRRAIAGKERRDPGASAAAPIQVLSAAMGADLLPMRRSNAWIVAPGLSRDGSGAADSTLTRVLSKQIQIKPSKLLGFPWFYSSESGLFKGLWAKK